MAVRLDVEMRFNLCLRRDPDAHQFDVVDDKVDFLFKRHKSLLVFIQHIAEQFAQFLYGLLRLFGVESRKGIDIVQRVEQKMRVQLVAQVLQFGLCAAFHGLLPFQFGFAPSQAHPDGYAQSADEYKADNVAQEEYVLRRHEHVRTRFGGRQADVMPIAQADGDDAYCRHVQQQKLSGLSLE